MKTLLAVIGQNLDMRCYLITGFLATELQTCFPLVSKTIQYTQYTVQCTQYTVQCTLYTVQCTLFFFTWKCYREHLLGKCLKSTQLFSSLLFGLYCCCSQEQ